jgi:hypothetical protein
VLVTEAVAPPAPVEIEAEERVVVLEEIAALAAAVHDPAARERWLALGREVAEGRLFPDQLARLESALALTLETGRVRRVQGPEAEQTLLRLYRKTPGGAVVEQLTRAANQALAGLAGQTLHGLRFATQGPGTFRLEIATASCQVTVEVGRRGVTVDSVGVEV